MERFFINEHMEKVRRISVKVVAVVFLLVSFIFLHDFSNSLTENGVPDNYWIIIQFSAIMIHFFLWFFLCFGIFYPKSHKLMLPWLCIWVPTFMVSLFFSILYICQLLIFTKKTNHFDSFSKILTHFETGFFDTVSNLLNPVKVAPKWC